MSFIDNKIAKIAQKDFKIKFYKRYLDDIIIVFKGSTKELHTFLDKINSIHNSIKFTMSHTTIKDEKCNECGCQDINSIPFLDTQCQIKNKKIITDLYRKPTDRNQYLLPTSCHPNSVTKNIPYSLALRIIRICSESNTRDKRIAELKEMLLDREYKAAIIDAAIARAKAVPRVEALKKVFKPRTTNRQVLVIRYDPRLPSVNQIVRKHHRTMMQDPYLAECFPDPPLIAYTRPKNIRDRLIKAKIPPNARPKRVIPGMHRCKDNCKICPYVNTCKVVKATHTDKIVPLSKEYNCKTKNIVYLVQCLKCKDQYIGESKATLEKRFGQHIGYVNNNDQRQATGRHFNSDAHLLSDMTITVLESINTQDEAYRKRRESHWILAY